MDRHVVVSGGYDVLDADDPQQCRRLHGGLAILGQWLGASGLGLGGHLDSFCGDRCRHSAFRAFSHLLDVPAQLAALANARRHLAPGGRLALDVFDPRLSRTAILEEPEELAASAETPRGRVQRFDRVTRDLARQVLTLRVRFVTAAPEDCGEGELQLRWFHRYELEHLLARAGFAIEALYGGFDRRPWAPGGETIAIARVAQRAGL